MANIAKYLKLRQYIMNILIDHAFEKIPLMSEREMCKKFNITRTTVRKALEPFIKENSIIAKRGCGMFLNGAVRNNTYYVSKRPAKILYILGAGRYGFADNWQLHIMENVCKYARKNNFIIQFVRFIGEDGTEAEELSMYSFDGVMWIRPATHLRPLLKELQHKVPVCVIADCADNDDFAVTVDYFKAGADAAAFFVKNNFRKVLCTCKNSELIGSTISEQFHNGWLSTMEKNNCKTKSIYLQWHTDFQKELINADKDFDAVFTHSAYFPGISELLKYLKKTECPVMVDSYDNVTFPGVVTPRWVIDLYPECIFKTAVEHLSAVLVNPDFPRKGTLFQAEITELM